MMTENKMYRKSRYKTMALIPLSAMLLLVIACVNGLFAETLPAGFSSQGSQLNLTNGAKVLYPASVDEAGDTVKKTVVKVIRKVPDSDGMVSETVHIRTADDSITEVRIVKDADIDVETEITTGVNINEDMIEHIETTIEHDSAGQKVIKKETVVIRHTNENQNSGKAVREVCSVGCIGCGLCAKPNITPSGKIVMKNNLPEVPADWEDFDLAVKRCPTKSFVVRLPGESPAVESALPAEEVKA